MEDMRAKLTAMIGSHADSLLELLRARDGGDFPDRWRMEISRELSLAGPGPSDPAIPTAPVFQTPHGTSFTALCGHDGSLPAYAPSLEPGPWLLVWAQKLRAQLGRPLLVYSQLPLHDKARGWLFAELGALVELVRAQQPLPSSRTSEDVQQERLSAAQARAKRIVKAQIAGRYGLPSIKHLPASVLVREVELTLLPLLSAADKGDVERVAELLGLGRRSSAPLAQGPAVPPPREARWAEGADRDAQVAREMGRRAA